MAMGIHFVCAHCGRSIQAWDDGNPYYLDQSGQKRYAYHPDPQMDRCIGNDAPHLCLACGHDFMVDNRAPITACPKCHHQDIVDTWHLDEHRCPYCSQGTFSHDPNNTAVS